MEPWSAGKEEPRRGSVISPVLANLFLHYAFDRWMQREHPDIPFERYAEKRSSSWQAALNGIRLNPRSTSNPNLFFPPNLRLIQKLIANVSARTGIRRTTFTTSPLYWRV